MVCQGCFQRKLIVCAFHTSLLTSIEDYLSTKEIEFLYLGRSLPQEVTFKICMQFAQIPSQRVLVVDTSSANFTQNFYFLRSAFPYGLPILFCESLWNLPSFEEPTFQPRH